MIIYNCDCLSENLPSSHSRNTILKIVPSLSDHDTVIINFQTLLHVIKQNPQKIYLYKKADWDNVKEKLSNISDVYFTMSPHSVHENWSFFFKNFQQILSDRVPTKTLGRRTHLPWISAPLKR